MTDTFDPCEICGARDWHIVYRGNVRDGIFGRSQSDATVSRCGDCGADRLDESVCPDMAFYETEAYRKKLQEELTAAGHYAVADELQVFTQQVIWPDSLRGKTVADVGCAGGAHKFKIDQRTAAVSQRGADAIGAGVTATNHDDILAFG